MTDYTKIAEDAKQAAIELANAPDKYSRREKIITATDALLACDRERQEALAEMHDVWMKEVVTLRAALAKDERQYTNEMILACEVERNAAEALAQTYRDALEQIVEFESGLFANAMGGTSRTLDIARAALERSKDA